MIYALSNSLPYLFIFFNLAPPNFSLAGEPLVAISSGKGNNEFNTPVCYPIARILYNGNYIRYSIIFNLMPIRSAVRCPTKKTGNN
jgi:hypothetical protein